MYKTKLKGKVHEMFQELEIKTTEIISTSRTYKMASERISNIVSARVSAESEGYIIDIYMELVARIKEEEFFKNPENLNAFYRLNLREEMNEKYHFEVKSLDTYKKGIEFNEINNLYVTAGTAAGTLVLGGILKFAISGVIQIPFALIIAGAVVVALSTYFFVPQKNKKEFERAVKKFLKDTENEILNWLAEIECYFESRVRTLYK